MSHRWRHVPLSPWRIRRVPPPFRRRDGFILATLVAAWLVVFVACPRLSSYRVTPADDGQPFVGHIAGRRLLMPGYRDMYPIRFALLVDCTDGRRRLVIVPFATFAHAKTDAAVTRTRDALLVGR